MCSTSDILNTSGLGIGDVWGDITGQNAAKDAANAMKGASNKSIALQREMWQKSLELNKPFYDAGVGALGQLQSLKAPSMTMDDFQASPDYQFRLQQGQNQILSGAGAQGMRLSGATLKALSDYGQNTAEQEYSSWYGRRMGEYQDQWNRLAQMAGIGQSANSAAMGANQNAAAGISQQYQNIGNANAAAAMQGYNGLMNLANIGASAFGMYRSDIRSKEAIEDADGLEFVNKLRPVKYRYKGKEGVHEGLIAQELKAVMDESGIEGEMHFVDSEGMEGIRYHELISPLIKAVQELSSKVEALEK